MKELIRVMVLLTDLVGAWTSMAGATPKAVAYSNGDVVYYYDDKTYTVGEDEVVMVWTSLISPKATSPSMTRVVIDETFKSYQTVNLASYFDGFSNATEIVNLEYLDTSKATSVYKMFKNCKKLTSLNLSNFTTTQMENMAQMFLSCASLTSLDLASFSDASLTGMGYMFQGCSKLTTIYATSAFDGSKLATESAAVFYNCKNVLVGGQGTVWDMGHTTSKYACLDGGADAPGYFTQATRTITVSAAALAAGHIASVSVMDAEGASLPGETAEGVTTYTVNYGTGVKFHYSAATGYVFDNQTGELDVAPSALKANLSLAGETLPATAIQTFTLTIDTSDFDEKKIAAVSVKVGDEVLTPTEEGGSVYVINYGATPTVVYTAAEPYVFDDAATREVALAAFEADAEISGEAIVAATLPSAVTLTIDTDNFAANNIQRVAEVKLLVDGSIIQPTSEGVYAIPRGLGFTITYQAADKKYFYIEKINSKEVLDSFLTDSSYAENGLAADASAVLPTADRTLTSAVSIRAFVQAENPDTLKICYNTETLVGRVYQRASATGYPSWSGLASVSHVVVDSSMSDYGQKGSGFQYLFAALSNVTDIVGLQNLNTSQATSFYEMFRDCKAVTNLNLRSFRTTKVTNMGLMFYGCDAIETLDLSKFSSESVTSVTKMFRDCDNLRTIYATESFDISKFSTEWVFAFSKKLVGGKGTANTVTDGTLTSATYGRLDGGPDSDSPGYFTYKEPDGFIWVIR